MTHERFLNLMIVILFVSAIIVGLASVKWLNPLFLILAYLILVVAIKLDTKQRHPFVVTETTYILGKRLEHRYLTFSYSIKWLKILYGIKRFFNPMVDYTFNTYLSFDKDNREKFLNDYFEEQD
jgi:predicted membrane protein